MARLNADRRNIYITPSPSPDAARYRVYVAEQNEPIGYTSPFLDVGDQTTVPLDEVAKGRLKGEVDQIKIGVSTIDTSGHESDLEVIENIPFDQSPPKPPAKVEIISG